MPVSDNILYEHPLNERTRTLLRLEAFFLQIAHFLEGRHPFETQASVVALIELLNYLDRHDLRSDLLKELEKHHVNFSKLSQSNDINTSKLSETLSALKEAIKHIKPLSLKVAQDLRRYELLNMIRQRINLSGSNCGVDIPAYHQWLSQPMSVRTADLQRWIKNLLPLYTGIDLLLRIIRNSGRFEDKKAVAGFYQQTLETQNPAHLLRIQLPNTSAYFPEVSGSKHRVTIRLMSLPSTGRPKQSTESFDFAICFCIL